jgi:hypothetical protein
MKRKILFLILIFAMLATAANAALKDIKDVSISLVNQDPDPAIAGDVVEIRLGIENRGGQAAENLIIEVVPGYPFELIAGEEAEQKITKLDAYQYDEDMKILKFLVRVNRDANAGEYELVVKDHEEGSSVAAKRSLSVDVKSKESAEIIHIDKTSLIPGKESSLKFTVNNVGNAPLRDMTFSWLNSDDIILPVGSDNTRYIKYLDVGESAELDYTVIPDTNADPGLYKLDLSLKYEDPTTGEENEISTIAGVYVGGATDFDVAFSESSNGETSFSIANIGSNPAYSVSVIIPQQDGWTVSGSNSMIIGNLNKGDYTVASFTLQAGRTAAVQKDIGNMSKEDMANLRNQMQSSSQVKVQIAYTDTMGNRGIVEKEVQINQQKMNATGIQALSPNGQFAQFGRQRIQQQTTFSKYRWYILAGAVLIVFCVLYFSYRKKKMINPDFRIKDLFKKKKKHK